MLESEAIGDYVVEESEVGSAAVEEAQAKAEEVGYLAHL